MKKMQLILVSLKHALGTCGGYIHEIFANAQVSEIANFTSKLAVVFSHETKAYLKGNSKIKEKFFKKILTQK